MIPPPDRARAVAPGPLRVVDREALHRTIRSPAAQAGAPCVAWSQHAADLAAAMAPQLEGWPETPATQALVLDGELLPMRAGRYLPAVDARSCVDRAIAVGCAVGEHLRSHQVIAGATAAWVLLGGRPPEVLELISPSHRTIIAGVEVHQAEIRPGDVVVLGGAPITAPGRIATDLLRMHPEHTACRIVEELLETGHLGMQEVARRLDLLFGAPHTRRARRLLREVRVPAP
ncbi:hypothetical protein [Brachybacterium hainanense]|uniref:AbiEi antitoxin C-terminal domain-containing protein n=1 Tax=Brachybacterium hainanense TaxID=1541174 RepID=A0ABV6RG88_9MICO